MAFRRRLPCPVVILLTLLAVVATAGCAESLPWRSATPAPVAPAARLEGDAPAAVARPYYYPERVVTLMVPSPRGTPMDRMARSLGAIMGKGMGQPLVVANRDADGVEAWSELKRAKPDGYTLGLVSSPEVYLTLRSTQDKPPFVLSDFAFLAGQGRDPLAVLVPSWGPFKSVEDLVQGAVAQPEAIVLAVGSGGLERLAATEFQRLTGTRFKTVSYPSGTEALAATMNWEAGATIGNLTLLSSAVRTGHGRILAVLDDRRARDFPQVPTLKERGIDLNLRSSLGYAAPRGTAGEITSYLTWALYQAMSDPRHQVEMRSAGLDLQFLSGSEYERNLAAGSEAFKPRLSSTP